MIMKLNKFGFVVLFGFCLLHSLTAFATKGPWDGSQPAQGVYFYWYEPSFYAGFAPRIQDPARAHIELARGNQVRMTMVLADGDVDDYLEDLIVRHKTYQELIDQGSMRLKTNKAYEAFVSAIQSAGVTDLVTSKETLGADEYHRKSIEVIERLNPGRVFHIAIPVTKLISDWHTLLSALTTDQISQTTTALDTANAVLPGRVNLYQLSPELQTSLKQAWDQAHAGASDAAEFRSATINFLQQATGDRYLISDDSVKALEFTSIYPVGTAQDWVTYKGRRIPAFGVHGVWHLIPRIHGKGYMGMVDYLSKNPGYGFIPMLGYQYASGSAYNSMHNAGVRSNLGGTHFLPKEWRNVSGERDPSKKYQNLWIVSRGPTSHGCTRMGSGHVSEVRHELPVSSEVMEKVAYYRNLPQCYDVFDIDGDGSPEVMGVKYYLAYSTTGHTPKSAYAQNKREPYYEWMYGDNIHYNPDSSAVLKEVLTCRFVGIKKAQEAQTYTELPLYEAEYIPEPIQFYLTKPVDFQTARGFEFNREIRKIGLRHTANRKALFLK